MPRTRSVNEFARAGKAVDFLHSVKTHQARTRDSRGRTLIDKVNIGFGSCGEMGVRIRTASSQ